MPESIRALLSSLTATSGESAASVYAKWGGVVLSPESADDSLEGLVRRHVYAAGIGTGGVGSPQFPAKVAASGKESLLGIIKAGGASGESVEQCLARTGLTGWS